MNFGEKLYALRKAQHWTQDFVAENVGVSRQSVSKWELNESVPDIEKLAQLSRLFSVTCDYLVSIENEENSINDVVEDENTAEIKSTASKGKRLTYAIIMLLFGIISIGTMTFVSTLVPAYIESESIVTKDDIRMAIPGTTMEVPESSVVTTRIEVRGNLHAFLLTYHLYWLAVISIAMIFYGCIFLVVSSAKKIKKGG